MLDKAQIEKSALYPAFLFLGSGGKLMMQYSMSVKFQNQNNLMDQSACRKAKQRGLFWAVRCCFIMEKFLRSMTLRFYSAFYIMQAACSEGILLGGSDMPDKAQIEKSVLYPAFL